MKGFVQLVRVVALALAFVLVLNCLTPLVYRMLPNDYVRTRLILDALDKRQPDIVLFGNSRGMSGLNAYKLSDSLHRDVLHCCSVSQRLSESMLYYDRLPASVRLVVQCIDEKEFLSVSPWMTEGSLIAFEMNGYKPDSMAKTLLYAPDYKRLCESGFRRNFRARSALRAGLSKLIVQLLDDDAPGRNLQDMRYPYMYPSDHSATYDRDLNYQRQYLPDDSTVFQMSPELKTYCAGLQKHLKARGITLCILLMPNCPALNWPRSAIADYRRMIGETLEGCLWLDAFEVVPTEGFYDPLHPNRIGGEILTQWLIGQLRPILNEMP